MMQGPNELPHESGDLPNTGEAARPASTLQRRRQIKDWVDREGSVRVAELSKCLGVSEVTIRSDLETLARQGALLRDHGGAVAHTHTSLTVAFEQRAQRNQQAKKRIAQAAIALIHPGDTILLDAGTTLMELAKLLENKPPLTVITNALNIAQQVGALPDVNVILAGGTLHRDTISALGPLAERDLRELVVDKLFLGVHGLDPQAGLLDVSVEVARIKSAMIASARQVILLADSSKWGVRALARVAPFSAVHTWITDTDLPLDVAEQLQAHGTQVQRV